VSAEQRRTDSMQDFKSEKEAVKFVNSFGKKDRFYEKMHAKIVAEFGVARNYLCVDCKSRAMEWSYDNNDPEELISDNGLFYSLDTKHYVPRCRRCHKDFDVACKFQERIKTHCKHNLYIPFNTNTNYVFRFCNSCGFYRRFLPIRRK